MDGGIAALAEAFSRHRFGRLTAIRSCAEPPGGAR